MKETEFSVEVERVSGFDFIVRFKEGMESAMMSEPRPLGSGEHPHAGHMLAAAMGHCMSASLLYCFERSRVEAGPMKTKILTKVEREPEVDNPEKAKRCISIFEEYCIVTQSVREGIDIEVEVIPLSRESD
jgi:uncharacterized OsmC-like protein